ncbi:CU044_5270 family protein [Micromonospora sp. NPDC018662]|uniref:CU044_5270 family protein n=1 Tax=Micromonospora sp. NPDC018662 TaxID=3364238 RepID=UPI003797BF97
MKDLDLVKRLGEGLDPDEDESFAALPTNAFRDVPRRRPLRPWQAGVAALAALGITAVVAGSWLNLYDPSESGATPRAATVLDNAAAVSQETTISQPQQDAYIFTETVSSYPAQVQQPDGSFEIIRDAPTLTQVWLPVDPAKAGQQRQRPKDGNAGWGPWIPLPACQQKQGRASVTNGSSFSECTRGVLPADFPTDPSAVLAWLRGKVPTGAPSPGPSAGRPFEGQEALAFERASSLLMQGTYLLPDQRSAIFKALAQLEGVEAARDVQDGAGRQGIGISAGGSEALVFDSISFAFLGTTSSAVIRQIPTRESGKTP